MWGHWLQLSEVPGVPDTAQVSTTVPKAWLSASAWVAITKCYQPGRMNNRHLFLLALKTTSLREQGARLARLLQGTPPGYTWQPSYRGLTRGRENHLPPVTSGNPNASQGPNRMPSHRHTDVGDKGWSIAGAEPEIHPELRKV